MHSIGRLDLLPEMFEPILVPPAVVSELRSVKLPDWATVVSLTNSVPGFVSRKILGKGETEAISLALEVRPGRLVMDDGPARSLAASLGLSLVGTLGVLLAAKRLGLVETIRGDVDALRARSFRISARVYRDVLTRAGEF